MKSTSQIQLDRVLPASLLLAMALLVGLRLPAQYFTENFDDVSALPSNGWAQQNRSTPSGAVPNWFQGDPGIFVAYNGPDTAYIGVSYNCIAGAGTISNWLFAPTRTFTNGEKISFWTRTVSSPNYADRLQLRLSLNGASTNVGTSASSVGDFTTMLLQINPNLSASAYPNAWREYTVIISGLPAPTSGRFAFRYFVGNGGPGGANSEYIGIDSVAYFLPPSGDLKMKAIHRMEYTVIPQKHQPTAPLMGVIENFGSTTVTNATLQVNIYNGQGTQVYSGTSAPIATMAPGDLDTAYVAAPPVLPAGDYTVAYIAKHGAIDGDHANDTIYDHFEIAPLHFARDNGVVVGSIGIGAYVGGYVGQQFELQQTDNLDSVWVHVTQGYAGKPLAAVVWDMVAGLPHQIVGATDTIVYGSDSAATYVLPMHDGRLQLPAGDFVVTMIEFDSTLHVGLAADVFTRGTTWLSWPTLPGRDWANVELFGLANYNHTQMIRAILSACDLTIATSATPESAPGALDGLASVVATGGTPPYTYAWSTGATTSAIGGLGTSPVTVTVTDASGCISHATVSLLVGLDAAAQVIDFGAFPNPNDGNFRVYCNSAAPTEVAMDIVDLLGRVVLHDQAPATMHFSKDVDLSAFPAGIYLLRLNAGGEMHTLKLRIGQ
jgi:Secretion system C-terminal sorting domain/SprB repeat